MRYNTIQRISDLLAELQDIDNCLVEFDCATQHSVTLRDILMAALPHVEAGGDWEAVCMLARDMNKSITEQQIVDELATMPEVPDTLKVSRQGIVNAYWDTGKKWPNWRIPTANRSKAKAQRHILIAEAVYPLLNRF